MSKDRKFYGETLPHLDDPRGEIIAISLNVLVTDEDIDDIMASVLDGGITYWCNKVKVEGEYLGEYASDQISKGGTLKIYDCEGEAVYALTKNKFLEGLKKYLEDPLYKDTLCKAEHEKQFRIDVGRIDAPASDMIIQYALFGEVVYG